MAMISVILNVYKRNNNLERQIDALRNQTVPINYEDISVWYNYSGSKPQMPRSGDIKTCI